MPCMSNAGIFSTRLLTVFIKNILERVPTEEVPPEKSFYFCRKLPLGPPVEMIHAGKYFQGYGGIRLAGEPFSQGFDRAEIILVSDRDECRAHQGV